MLVASSLGMTGLEQGRVTLGTMKYATWGGKASGQFADYANGIYYSNMLNDLNIACPAIQLGTFATFCHAWEASALPSYISEQCKRQTHL